jgi:hypothetical protein
LTKKSAENMNSRKNLIKEAVRLRHEPPEGIRLSIPDEDCFDELFAFILGPGTGLASTCSPNFRLYSFRAGVFQGEDGDYRRVPERSSEMHICYKDLSSKRFANHRRDLCEYAEKGLEQESWTGAHPSRTIHTCKLYDIAW